MTTPFQVGPWRADPLSNRLTASTGETTIEPKVMDLLALLASDPGRVFLREELDAMLWPNVTVGEDTLARTVSKLRRALGDDAAAPRFIETIPKRGYRLTADVAPIAPSVAATPSSRKNNLRIVGAIAAAGLFVAAGWLLATRDGSAPTSTMASDVETTTERAHDLYMRFTRADNEAAIALYERAIAADPDYAPAQSGLANALVQRVIRWRSPPGAAPSATSLAEAIASGAYLQDDARDLLQRAIDLGERAVRLSPDDADALKSLGFAYSAAGDLEKARRIYAQALTLDADAWEVMINLGELAKISGDPDAALSMHQRAYAAMDRLYPDEPQRIGPWRAPLGVLIGDQLEQRNDLAGAESWYRKVLDQTPFEPEATSRLAALLRDRGAAAEASALCAALAARIGPADDCPARP